MMISPTNSRFLHSSLMTESNAFMGFIKEANIFLLILYFMTEFR